jgi:molybdopterin biosynthesis enzyme
MKLAGHNTPGLTKMPARLAQRVTGQNNWTQAIFGALVKEEMEISFHPDQRPASRLKSMAEAQAVLLIPEGVSEIDADETVQVQALGSP